MADLQEYILADLGSTFPPGCAPRLWVAVPTAAGWASLPLPSTDHAFLALYRELEERSAYLFGVAMWVAIEGEGSCPIVEILSSNRHEQFRTITDANGYPIPHPLSTPLGFFTPHDIVKARSILRRNILLTTN